ncbi:MAG: nucleoside deaminase [Ginsengibacter sp.]
MIFSDDYFMGQALKEAVRAFENDEVPIGAVVVIKDKIIAKGYNQVELLNDATAHAEIIALTAAFNAMGAKYLPDATIYITIEPCTMCCGALYWSKIARVVYGASDVKHGGISLHPHENLLHPKTALDIGIRAEECIQLMKAFFKAKR